MSHFEVRHYDTAGRLGELMVPRRDVTVETPALLPVVNPHVQTVSPAAGQHSVRFCHGRIVSYRDVVET